MNEFIRHDRHDNLPAHNNNFSIHERGERGGGGGPETISFLLSNEQEEILRSFLISVNQEVQPSKAIFRQQSENEGLLLKQTRLQIFYSGEC